MPNEEAREELDKLLEQLGEEEVRRRFRDQILGRRGTAMAVAACQGVPRRPRPGTRGGTPRRPAGPRRESGRVGRGGEPDLAGGEPACQHRQLDRMGCSGHRGGGPAQELRGPVRRRITRYARPLSSGAGMVQEPTTLRAQVGKGVFARNEEVRAEVQGPILTPGGAFGTSFYATR